MKVFVLSALAVIFTTIVFHAIVGAGGGEHRIDENMWDPD